MAERKAFLLRVDPALLEAMQRWANADLRSLNAQIEFVLRRSLEREGRRSTATPSEAAGVEVPPSAATPDDASPPLGAPEPPADGAGGGTSGAGPTAG